MIFLLRWWRRWRSYRAAVQARRELARLGRVTWETMHGIRSGKHERYH
jgi:hypothetical protein